MFSCLWFSSAYYETTIWNNLFLKIISICFCSWERQYILGQSYYSILFWKVQIPRDCVEFREMFMFLILSPDVLHSWIYMSFSGNQRPRDFKWAQTRSLVQFFFVIVLKLASLLPKVPVLSLTPQKYLCISPSKWQDGILAIFCFLIQKLLC